MTRMAAARRLGCSILLTEDLQDGQELGSLVARSPSLLDVSPVTPRSLISLRSQVLGLSS